jgi:glycosyltransferase involved in cell wall biosynthesis
MRDTAVVVPCYNEAQRLDTSAFRAFAAAHGNIVFLFVNDGSTDETQVVLDGLREQAPGSFRILRLEPNVGKAEAVRRGMLRALEARPAYLGYWDADLATPLEVICDFRAVLEENATVEAVLGSRVRLLGRQVYRNPLRHYLGRVFATCSSLALGMSVYDTQCGAKLFRTSATTELLFREPFLSSWIFDVEVLARLIRQRHLDRLSAAEGVLFEYPVPRWRDVAGSKIRLVDFLRAPLELLAIYRRYLTNLPDLTAVAGVAPPPHFTGRRGTSAHPPRRSTESVDPRS